MAGGYAEPAYALGAEVTRGVAEQEKGYSLDVISVDLVDTDGQGISFELHADDTLLIRRLPNYEPPAVVTLEGEVRFPGDYRIPKDETLYQLLRRAGGLTDEADPRVTIFTRESLKQVESQQIQQQQQQLQRDIARAQLEVDPEKAGAVAAGVAQAQEIASKLSSIKAVGRMSIDLPRLIKGDKAFDVRLVNGDVLKIGRAPQAVTVLGEVQYPTSHQYRAGEGMKYYLNRSGGTSSSADKSRIYLIRTNGEIVAQSSLSFWGQSIKPGDTVIVPINAKPIDGIKLTANITQILSQIAISAVALSAL
jgi:protein involved in polysaccharide export with SLBB domain